MVFKTSKTTSTANPISLNGNKSNQIKGYNIRTAIARGKEIIARITHNMKVNIKHPQFL